MADRDFIVTEYLEVRLPELSLPHLSEEAKRVRFERFCGFVEALAVAGVFSDAEYGEWIGKAIDATGFTPFLTPGQQTEAGE